LEEPEIIDLVSLSRRPARLRAARLVINALAILVAVGFLADGVPPLAHELQSERDARADAMIAAFLASLTLDEKARLHRVLSSTDPNLDSLHGKDADDKAVLEKFRVFWQPFQNYRTQVELWAHAVRSVSSDTKAGEVWGALFLLAAVAMSGVALRAHVREA
jgi:hypothetical protein